MTLKDEAIKLAEALEDIVSNLELYGSEAKSEYAQKTAQKLKPAVVAFNSAVNDECSRKKAHEIITDIEQLMSNINGAATKGDMAFDNNNALNRYWELKTIFQESKYRDESL